MLVAPALRFIIRLLDHQEVVAVILGIIPARRGSKRLPRKNIAPLGDIPLIQWTFMAATLCKDLSKTVVTTDYDLVGVMARNMGLEVLWRPPELCVDEMPMLPVVRHALSAYPKASAFVLLQPTSPFRRAEHITEALTLWNRKGRRQAVVSVNPAGRENGAIFISSAESIRRGDHIYDEAGGQWHPFEMTAVESIDIDTEDDLRLAQATFEVGEDGSGEIH
jgi:CMP-N-acetylneuraminic acid synthetase